MGASSSDRLPPLFLIADAPTVGDDRRLIDLVGAVLAAAALGRLAIVDRDRAPHAGGTSDRDRFARLEALRALTSDRGAWLIVNGRVDLAVAAGADGVQLPERGLAAAEVRETFPALRVGRSCHDLAGARAAAAAGAHWVVLAPVFAPLSKPAPSRPGGVSMEPRQSWPSGNQSSLMRKD